MSILKNMYYILPVLMYYFIESIIIGFIIYLFWILSLKNLFFNFEIEYVEWVIIIFCIKAIFFDVFKLLKSLNIPQDNNNNVEKNEV